VAGDSRGSSLNELVWCANLGVGIAVCVGLVIYERDASGQACIAHWWDWNNVVQTRRAWFKK